MLCLKNIKESDTESNSSSRTSNGSSEDESGNEKAFQIDLDKLQFELSRVYKRRWVILFLFCILNALIGAQRKSFIPVSWALERVFDIDAADILFYDWLVFPAAAIIVCIPTTFMTTKLNTRCRMLMATALLLAVVASKVRAIEIEVFWITCHINSVALAFSIALVFTIMSELAVIWFPVKEHIFLISSSWSIYCFANTFAMLVALDMVTTEIHNYDMSNSTAAEMFLSDLTVDIQTYEVFFVVVTICYLITIIIYFPPKPPMPINLKEEKYPEKVKENAKALWQMRQVHLLILVFGLAFTVRELMEHVIKEISFENKVPEDNQMILGFATDAGGFALCFTSALFQFRFPRIVRWSTTFLLMLTISGIFWTLLLHSEMTSWTYKHFFLASLIHSSAITACVPLMIVKVLDSVKDSIHPGVIGIYLFAIAHLCLLLNYPITLWLSLSSVLWLCMTATIIATTMIFVS